MKTYDYEEWLAQEPLMREKARFVLSFFDKDRLKRKKRDSSRGRPSKQNRENPTR